LNKFIKVHSTVENWIYYAKFEIKYGDEGNVREIFETAIENCKNNDKYESLFLEYAKFEESKKELERTRVIYKYALDNVSKVFAEDIYNKFIAFEKQYGDKEDIERVILSKKRFDYEEILKNNSSNYDIWFDYLKLEESYGDKNRIEELYERAISNIPKVSEKIFWKRYIYLWIYYSIFSELILKDIEKTRQIFNSCLKIIPKNFSFSKIWILFSQFEIRQKNVPNFRKILGNSLGILKKKDKIFKIYINTGK
jgi:crooked neck